MAEKHRAKTGDFILIFRVLHKNQTSVEMDINTGRRRFPKSAAMVLSAIPLMVMFCVILGFVTTGIKDAASLSVLLTAVVSAVQIFILFTAVNGILNSLYLSRDNAFLASLPVSPTSIFLAKFTLLYVNTLKVSGVLLVPTLLTVSVTYAAGGNHVFYGFYPLTLLIAAVAPALPLFVITLLTMPILWLGSFFKGRSVFKTVFSIVFYILLMTAYLCAVAYFNTLDASGFGQSGTMGFLTALAKVMYPDAALINMCLGVNAGVNSGIALACWLGLTAITVLLSSLFYRRITSRNTEARAEETVGKTSFRRHNLIFSLVKKDFLSIVRTPSLALGTFANIIMAPVIIIVMRFAVDTSSQEGSALTGELTMTAFLLMYSLAFLCCSNMIAMTAYTREGEAFVLSKNLPIKPVESVVAKLLFAVLVPAAMAVIIFFLAVFLYKISFLSALGVLLTTMLFCAGSSGLHIYFDIKKGNIHWKTQADMRNNMRGNLSAIIGVMVCIIPACGFLIAGFMLSPLEGQIGSAGVLGIFWSMVSVISVAVAVAGLYILFEKGVPLYDKIGETRHVSANRGKGFFGNSGGGNFLGR